MRKIVKKGKRSNRKERLAAYEEILNQGQGSSRIELIQMLIPLGLQAVEEALQSEVMRIAGDRYSRAHPEFKRWGTNGGSVFLGDQKVSVRVPRVRDVINGKEVPLTSYRGLQNPGSIDEAVFKRLVNGISTRKYERVALAVPATFGIKSVLANKAIIQRCQWHKRENVVEYPDKKHRPAFRRKLQAAYEQPTYEAARKKLNLIKKELAILNQSAVRSLEEGLEETLTLHRLGVFSKLGTSFKTSNCIENIMRQVGIYTDRVSHWRNSDQRQRWVGTALQEIEPHLRRVKGYRHLKELREAMKQANSKNEVSNAA